MIYMGSKTKEATNNKTEALGIGAPVYGIDSLKESFRSDKNQVFIESNPKSRIKNTIYDQSDNYGGEPLFIG